MTSANGSPKLNQQVQIYVVEAADIELLQSAEIVSRELKSRGFQIVEKSATGYWAQIRLSPEALSVGQVEVSTASVERRVALEDVVEKIQEMSDARIR